MKHLLVSRPTPTFSGRATNAGLQTEGAITRDKSRKTMGKLRFVTFSDIVPAALEKKRDNPNDKRTTTRLTKSNIQKITNSTNADANAMQHHYLHTINISSSIIIMLQNVSALTLR